MYDAEENMRILILAILASVSCFCAEELDFSYRVKAESTEKDTIRTGYGLGSGVKIDGEKMILTASHVVKGEEGKVRDEIFVDFPAVGWIRCRVVKIDAQVDLCLLKPALEPPNTAKLAKEDGKQKDQVKSTNYFASRQMTVVDGVLCGKQDGKWLAVIDKIGHGCSGSGVFKDGKLIGVVIAMGQADKDEWKFGFVVTLDAVKKFVESK